jgi:transposase
MLAELLLPDEGELRMESCRLEDGVVVIRATARQVTANCRQCGTPSWRVHSHYQRTLADLPCTAFPLRLDWIVRRFFCDNSECQQVTFTEQIPDVAARYARKTKRLANFQTQLAFALGGKPGARLARALGIEISSDTLLRLIRDAPDPEYPTPRVLGVDDWALRKGQAYGTILVDLEGRCPVDLIPERSADKLATWLKAHPGVEIISRDRSNEYKNGATTGSPDAIQVADRWHLMKNLREALERYLEQNQTCLAAAGEAKERSPQEAPTTQPAKLTKQELERQIKRAKRMRRYEAVRQLHQQGLSQREIARRMAIGPQTVRKYIKADRYPEYAQRIKQDSILDPYIDYLEKRWQDGVRNASALWRELREQGYTGARGMVGLWAAKKRTPKQADKKSGEPESTEPISGKWSAKRASWLLFTEENKLGQHDWQALQRMHQTQPELVMVQELTQDFLTMIRQRQPEALSPWLERVKQSKIAALAGFHKGIQQDLAAVQAALTYEWSSGQTEGQVNRLKMVKRQMYGRAKFDLLRKRFLGLPNPP